MSKLRGDDILLYTEQGLIAHSTTASLEYSNEYYDLLPNSYSRKKQYGIVDWTISGDFFYDTDGNYADNLDRITAKEKVSVLIIENGTNYKFGYGLISNMSISYANQQTVAFSIEILASSKLTSFKNTNISFDGSFDVLRLLNNEFYKANLELGDLTIDLLASNGVKNIVSTSINNETLTDYILYKDTFIINTDSTIYRVNKNGYVEEETTTGANTYSVPRVAFDDVQDYIAFLSSNNTVRLYNTRLTFVKAITSANLIDYIQLSNKNFILATTSGFEIKDIDNNSIVTSAESLANTKFFKSNDNQVYVLTDAGLYIFTDLVNDNLTRTEISTTFYKYATNIEGGFTAFVEGTNAIIVKGEYIVSSFSSVIPSGDLDFDEEFAMDSNGVVYSVTGANMSAHIPIELGIANDFDMSLNKIL